MHISKNRILNSIIALLTKQPFLIDKDTFLQKNGDVLYIIKVETTKSRRIRVTFGAPAICDPYCAVRDVIDLAQLSMQNYNGYHYETTFRENVLTESILQDASSTLIPFFLDCTNAESAFSATIRMKRLVEDHRLNWLALESEKDLAEPFEKRVALSPELYYLAMKCNNYGFMRKHILERMGACDYSIAKSADALRSCAKADMPFYENQLNRSLKLKCELEGLLIRIERSDTSFFQKMIIDNEEQTMIKLKL